MEPSYSNYEYDYSIYDQSNNSYNPRYSMSRDQGQPSNAKYLDKYLEDFTIEDDQFEVDYHNIEEKNQFQNFEHYEQEEPQPQEYDQVKVLCTFCNNSYPLGDFAEHEEQCEMKKITCEQCGKKVLIEAFEMHEMECIPTGQVRNLRPNNYPRATRRQGTQAERPQRQPNYLTNNIRNTRQTGNRFGGGNQQQNVIPQIQPRRNYANRLPLYDYHQHIDQLGFMDEYQQQQQHADIPESATYEDLLALDENIVKKGLTKPQLDKFKTRTFITSTESTKECSICMADFEFGERLRKIKCAHEFHMSCIDTWLKENITCPICKKEMR